MIWHMLEMQIFIVHNFEWFKVSSNCSDNNFKLLFYIHDTSSYTNFVECYTTLGSCTLYERASVLLLIIIFNFEIYLG